MKELKLSQFNIAGIFPLRKEETYGIESLVHELKPDLYLSRNLAYFANTDYDLSYRVICKQYNYLNSLLPANGKQGFIICEKMHELATRISNSILQASKSSLYQDGENFDFVAQKCVQECADNLVELFYGGTANKVDTKLDEEKYFNPSEIINSKIPFMDNKKQIIMAANAMPTEFENLITPGRGSSKLGAIVQSVRKRNGLKPLAFTQLYYSYYRNQQTGKVFEKPVENLGENLLVMDDIIVKGYTLMKIKDELQEFGHKVTTGAVSVHLPDSSFYKPSWQKSVDIIPNQYSSQVSEQCDVAEKLDHYTNNGVFNYIKEKPMNWFTEPSADYVSMRKAERTANNLGIDLYNPANVSLETVAFDTKMKEQITAFAFDNQK